MFSVKTLLLVALWFCVLSELDNEGVVDDPDDFTPEQISADIEVTEDMMDQSNDKRSEAMSAMSDGNHFSEMSG